MEFTDIIKKYNKVLYDELDALMNESLENDKKIFDISTLRTGYMFSEFIDSDEEEYKKNQESEKIIVEKTIEFFNYVGTYLIELYEKLYEEKERKKDTHGSEIIFSTERRNNHLLRDERQISDAIKIPELWDSYLEKNAEIEDNLFNLLKQHNYSM